MKRSPVTPTSLCAPMARSSPRSLLEPRSAPTSPRQPRWPPVGDAGLLRKSLAQPNYRTSGDRLDFQVVDGREHQRQPAAALLELTALLQGQPEVAAIADLGREGVGFDVRRDANQPLLARRSVLDGVCDCFGHGQP